jgi:tRNA pseudouridine32 synthase/23S rRNA pseudouridine746 synthase
MSIYDMSSIAVVWADDSLVVVDKPPGLPSVTGRAPGLQDCAHSRLQLGFADALVVHRLDMPTSGLLMFARGLEMQRALSQAFATRRISKHYIAVVHGDVGMESGSIDLPLRADWPNRPRQIVDTVTGKAATTHWRRLDSPSLPGTSRLELMPVTGRSHQLRVHLLAIGHPIVGDGLYGQGGPAAAGRLHLHACRLDFDHPRTGMHIELTSTAPF